MRAKTPGTLADILNDMEPAIGEVRGWNKALIAIGSAEYQIDPHGIAMIAHALERSVDALGELWRSAHALAVTAASR